MKMNCLILAAAIALFTANAASAAQQGFISVTLNIVPICAIHSAANGADGQCTAGAAFRVDDEVQSFSQAASTVTNTPGAAHLTTVTF